MKTSRDIELDKVRESLRQQTYLNLAVFDVSLEAGITALTIGLQDINYNGTKIVVNSKISQIKNRISEIRKELEKCIKLDPEKADFMQGEHSFEVYRLLCTLGLSDVENLRQFNDESEKLNVRKEE
ncbi:hypothetical protein SPHINGO8BC_51476 [Sphingobacterium multivorum]|uniref:Uncharacterized protein n=2 Tax=Sphingobacterium multivorum TaxID=28454 RepID=A0A654D2S6_SPHMU|nr:hypothetical protein SPHINGO8BC_51476 [Sphingobacterium multivorum]